MCDAEQDVEAKVIPEEFQDFILEEVLQGHYATATDVIRAALSLFHNNLIDGKKKPIPVKRK